MMKKATSGVLGHSTSQGWGQVLDYGSPRLDPILVPGGFVPSGLAANLLIILLFILDLVGLFSVSQALQVLVEGGEC